MRVLYGEDPASHTGPESWGFVREGASQALTGESAGRVLSLEKPSSGVPTSWACTEGNTVACETAST